MTSGVVKTKVDLSPWQFDVNIPDFLREAALCGVGGMYVVCYECFRIILSQVADRATELNDPVMNVLMLRLNLYECENKERRKLMRKEIDRYYEMLRKEVRNE